jgi:signal transduction histidine kinase
VGNTLGIHHRLLTVLVLGVIVSALSAVALVRLFTISTRQRVERARDEARAEAALLAERPEQVLAPSAGNVVGMRGGSWDGVGAPRSIPAGWLGAVRSAVSSSRAQRAEVVSDEALEGGRLVVVARPAVVLGAPTSATLPIVWAGVEVKPSANLRMWAWIVTALALATAVLVATSAFAIATMNRGAADLRASLRALALDLRAPIPKPSVRELRDVADGVSALVEDLSRARQKEKQFATELARQERLAVLGRVVAGVAHEVRNPLASIKLRLDLASTDKQLPKGAELAISHASAEIERLDRLVADLLIVAGRAPGPLRPTALEALVRARVELLEPWASERKVTFEVSGAARAAVDNDSLSRVLDNLLRNAVEASPVGARVAASVYLRGERAVLEVRDHGAGVALERVGELFEPFFTTKPEGTGLGLALSRAIARAHAGEVSYVRDTDCTVFELELPCAAASSPTVPEAPTRAIVELGL